jgi:hypothetical protein
VEEDDNFVGLLGRVDKATAAPQPSMEDGSASKRTASKANKGAKEMMEERRSDAVW